MIKLISSVLFLILLPLSVWAEVPLDIVFDIDQTIATMIHDKAGGDFLLDPSNPQKNMVSISFEKTVTDSTGKSAVEKLTERYRYYDGVTELMEELKRQQAAGKIRISFFSGGTEGRNLAILDSIKLSDGTSLKDLATPSRIYSRHHLAPTGKGKEHRIREQFKKDLTIINKNLEDVILIDDIKEFVPESQKATMFWIGEDFPYPERVWEPPKVLDPDLLFREKNKFQWIQARLMEAIDRRFKEGKHLPQITNELTHNNTRTPFTAGEEKYFKAGSKCSPAYMRNIFRSLQSPKLSP